MSTLRTPDAPSMPTSKAPWAPPTMAELPRLTELTLQSGNPVPGSGGGGSTVF